MILLLFFSLNFNFKNRGGKFSRCYDKTCTDPKCSSALWVSAVLAALLAIINKNAEKYSRAQTYVLRIFMSNSVSF